MMKNILLTLGDGRTSEVAVARAEELARAFGARIWVLQLSPPDPRGFAGLEATPQYARDSASTDQEGEWSDLSRITAHFKERGLKVQGLEIPGNSAEVIFKKVSEIPADLVIVTHRKGNFFYQLFVGNIEGDIVEDLNIPVLLVPSTR